MWPHCSKIYNGSLSFKLEQVSCWTNILSNWLWGKIILRGKMPRKSSNQFHRLAHVFIACRSRSDKCRLFDPPVQLLLSNKETGLRRPLLALMPPAISSMLGGTFIHWHLKQFWCELVQALRLISLLQTQSRPCRFFVCLVSQAKQSVLFIKQRWLYVNTTSRIPRSCCVQLLGKQTLLCDCLPSKNWRRPKIVLCENKTGPKWKKGTQFTKLQREQMCRVWRSMHHNLTPTIFQHFCQHSVSRVRRNVLFICITFLRSLHGSLPMEQELTFVTFCQTAVTEMETYLVSHTQLTHHPGSQFVLDVAAKFIL